MASRCPLQMHSGCSLHFTPGRPPQSQPTDKHVRFSPLERQTIQACCSERQPQVGFRRSVFANRTLLHSRTPHQQPTAFGISGVASEATMGNELLAPAESAPKRGPVINVLSNSFIEELVKETLVWATLHGALVGDKSNPRSGTSPGVGMVHVPFALLPTPFPRHAFTQAISLATHYNTLVDRVSQDSEFLLSSLAQTRKADPFTAKIMDIYEQVLAEGITQDIQLGLHRSDYMLDMATGSLLQVEINTISSSFAGLGDVTSKLHKYLVRRYGEEIGLIIENIPENTAGNGFAEALGRAWLEYADPNAVILMVVHAQERNMYDQHWLSLKVFERFGARVLRKTFAEVNAEGRLDEKRRLMIGKQSVAVVYYRSGYAPEDYECEADWDARLMMERATAVKCPSAAYHLAGAKKVQQELAMDGVLERFLDDEEAVAQVRRSFAGLWSLSGDSSAEITREALTNPEGFVLKPQREGGGNNIYGKDVATTISKLSKDEAAAYILMQRIFPAVHTSHLIRDGACRTAKTISELGIFGAYLRNGRREVLNKPAGHLVRSKVADSDEGGVAAGYGVLDSPYLT